MKKQDYKEQERHYYFFDYLFWLGEITWENYHKVNFKQPRGSDMLWACITLFIFMPVLTIAGHFLDDLAFEVFGAVLLIVYSVSVFMTDRLFGKIYPPSRRKAVVQALCGAQVQSLPAQPVLFHSLFASYSRNGFIRNCSEMDN
ncbi:hypothetical protein [Paraprevotella xylaniphila]|uniref:hypothetical protein n=1 Tax=Paraprevotella xylaniphila TaxID=454155 RepID=UPI0039F4CB59